MPRDHQEIILKAIKRDGLFCLRDGTVCYPAYAKKSHKGNRGYETIQLMDENGKWFMTTTHRLVFLYFNGKYDKKLQINHKDGNKRNNKLSNLEVVTRSRNIKHSFDTGLNQRIGSNHSGAKLNSTYVKLIRRAYRDKKMSYREMGKKFGVSVSTIANVINHKVWNHVK